MQDPRRSIYFIDENGARYGIKHTNNRQEINSKLVDENGTAYGLKHIDNKLRTSSIPYLYDIAEGNVINHDIEIKFGCNTSVGASLEDVWDGSAVYSYLSAATVLKISSSSTDDDAGGTGALTVQIYGLDTNYDEINEIITLNGQTEVPTVNEYLRVFRIIVRSAGSGGSNAGIIYAGTGTVTNGVPANSYAQITIGRNQTLMALWTVPNSKTAYLVGINASTSSNKVTEVSLYVRPLNEVFQIKRVILLNQGSSNIDFPAPLALSAKSDITLLASASGGGGIVAAAFYLWYES